LSRRRGVAMSTYTGRSSGARGALHHWFLDIALAVAAATLAVEALNNTRLGSLLIEAERDLLSRLLSSVKLRTIAMGYNVLLVYGWGHAVTLVLTPACSGLYAYTAFTVSSLVLANVEWRRRLVAAAVYAPILVLGNIVRILAATALGVREGLHAFRLFHDYVGSGLYLLLYAVLWLDWLYRSLPYASSHGLEAGEQ